MSGTQEGTGTDVVVRDDGGELDVTPRMIAPTPELVAQAKAAVLDGELPPEVGDPAVTARAIKQRILDGSLEDALSPQGGLPAWRDYMGEDVTVFSFHFNPSQFADDDGNKAGAYAVVELMLSNGDGEITAVTCGGGNVLATLIKAWETESFPFRCKLVEKGTGTPGRSVLWLEKV